MVQSGSVFESVTTHSAVFEAQGGMWAPLWAVFGEIDPSQYDWLVSIVLWVYILMGSVVLVNLLIAMFSSTLERVQAPHERERAS